MGGLETASKTSRLPNLCEWKNKFPEFSEALKKGKDVADYIVENELFESCKTRTVTVKKPIKLKKVMVDGKKRLEEERIEYAEEQVVVPANVTAQIFWLKNRKKTKWSEKTQEEAFAQGETPADELSKALFEISEGVDHATGQKTT